MSLPISMHMHGPCQQNPRALSLTRQRVLATDQLCDNFSAQDVPSRSNLVPRRAKFQDYIPHRDRERPRRLKFNNKHRGALRKILNQYIPSPIEPRVSTLSAPTRQVVPTSIIAVFKPISSPTAPRTSNLDTSSVLFRWQAPTKVMMVAKPINIADQTSNLEPRCLLRSTSTITTDELRENSQTDI